MGNLFNTFRKFFISGAGAAFVNFAVYYVLEDIFLVNYLISGCLAFLISFIFAFFMHRYWSFGERKHLAFDRQLVLYFLTSFTNLILTLVVLSFLVSVLHFPNFISYVFSAGAITVLSFVINNFFVFNKSKLEGSPIWKMLITTLILSCILYTIRVLLFPFEVSTDTITFIDTAKYFTGDLSTAPGFRLLKPLAPALIALIHILFNMDYMLALNFLVFATYIALSISALFFFYVFFKGEKYATYAGTILTISAYPILKYGLDPMTEVGAMVFVFLASAFLVLYNREEDKSKSLKYLLASLFFILIGFLWKEYTALTGIALFLVVVVKFYKDCKKNFLDLSLVVLVPATFLIILNLICYYLFQYTYLDWFAVGQESSDAYTQFTLYYLAKSIFGTILLGWVFFLFGIYKFKTLDSNQKKEIIILSLITPLVFSWGYVSSRLFFPAIIPVIILSAYGLLFLKEKYGYKLYIFSLMMFIIITFIWMFAGKLLAGILGN